MNSWMNSFLILAIFLHLGIYKCHGDVLKVPALDATHKDVLQVLELGAVTFNVPAIYVFGDSTVDSGNNNYIPSLSKSNYSPFGIDFVGGKATGRFSNGRNEADFVAQILGLPFPPAYLGLSAAEHKTLKTGVNYASSACGVLPETGKFFTCLPFDKQIENFEATLKNLQPSADDLSKSLFFISIGNADVSTGYDFLDEAAKKATPFPAFAQTVSEQFSIKIQKLYDLGARKFLLNNVGMMGCGPMVAVLKGAATCDAESNGRAQTLNKLLTESVPKLQSKLAGSKFIIADTYKVFSDIFASPASYGMTHLRESCCVGAENGTRPCIPNMAPCPDRTDHVYFDPFHASENTHFILAKRCFKESSICTPISLTDMLKS